MNGRIAATMLAALLLWPCEISAEEVKYPTGPITVIVPYAAGGPTDTVARLVSDAMGRHLGQRMVVENVAGAGGTIGAARIARSEPDGHSLLLNHIGMATSATLYPKAPYSPADDFAPIGLIADVPMTMVGRSGLPPNTISELIPYIRSNKDKVTYAHAGPGTASYLCGMLFMAAADLEFASVAYRGTGPAMTDLVGGQVDFMCDQTTNTTSYIQSGNVKPFLAMSASRLPTLPNVPSTKESGLDKLDLAIWHGLYAPKGTPPAVIAKLQSALDSALDDPALAERFAALGGIIVPKAERTPEALRKKLAEEAARWRTVLGASSATHP